MANYVEKGPCPDCGSPDNLAIYDDGSSHCFGADCEYHTGPGGKAEKAAPSRRSGMIPGAAREIKSRKIPKAVCSRFGYMVGEYQGRACHIADFRGHNGEVVSQHLRIQPVPGGEGKPFRWVGKMSATDPMFGQHLWGKGKALVITEGELDAMSVDVAFNGRQPVVSIKSGVSMAPKELSANLKFIGQFDRVILYFDDDAPGESCVKKCLKILPTGKVSRAKAPGFKDANEALVAGKVSAIVDAVRSAAPASPESSVDVEQVLAKLKKPVLGYPFMFKPLTDFTFGRMDGQVIVFGGGTGAGKTDFHIQQAVFDMRTLGLGVGGVFLEQTPEETVPIFASKMAGKDFTDPSNWPSGEQDWVNSVNEAMQPAIGKLKIFDSQGVTDWDPIENFIRYHAEANGTKVFYLDNLSALVNPDAEKESLEKLLPKIVKTGLQTRAIIHVISHLSTNEKHPHEEGGRVMVKHFKGSRSIGFWPHIIIGAERNQQAVGIDRLRTTYRMLKSRRNGKATGSLMEAIYNVNTGLMEMADPTRVQPELQEEYI